MICTSIRELISDAARDALKARGRESALPAFDLSVPPPRVPGDLAANLALMVAKDLGEPPRKLAEEIIAAVGKSALVGKAEVAGAGFVNVWLSDGALRGELESLLGGRRETPATKGPKTLIEF